MPDPHVIRLRGPWEYEPLEQFASTDEGQRASSTADLPPGGKVQMSSDWSATLGADFLGRVRFTRHFNLPTNLEPAERVWLVFDGVDHSASVTLNGEPLGTLAGMQTRRVDITGRLALRNRLEVEVSLALTEFADTAARGDRAGKPGGLTGEVRLEIEPG